ncbi:MAG: putative Ig domain-containing protein [Desulfomonilia bacterium]
MLQNSRRIQTYRNGRQGSDRVKSRSHLLVCVLLITGLVFLSSCQGSSSSNPGTGSITFGIQFPDSSSSSQQAPARYKDASFDCEEFGLASVEALVYDADDAVVAQGGPWECDLGEGTIPGVPEGSDMTIVLELMDDSGTVTYRGERSGVTVAPGEVTDVGLILIRSLGNNAPEFTQQEDQSVAEGEILTFTVSATDFDSDPLTYSASNLPDGATFNSSTGEFSWVAGCTAAGTYTVTFTVSDDGSPPLTDSMDVVITVTVANCPPVFEPISDITALEGDDIRFRVVAIDPEEDVITYEAENLPLGAEFSPSTGEFTWNTTASSTGEYIVTFTATDNGEPNQTATVDVTITVTSNRPPVLETIGTQSMGEGDEIQIILSANDPDGDAITYYAADLPLYNASFNPDTREFSWQTQTSGDQGEHKVLFIVVDDGYPPLSDYEEVVIEVGDMTGRHYPVLNPIGPKSVANVGDFLSFTISATDSDDDSLLYYGDDVTGKAVVPGFELNSSTGEFTWDSSNANEPGNYYVLFEVEQYPNYIYTDSEEVTITVGGVNRPPVLTPIGERLMNNGEVLTFVVTATDPEDDLLFYSIESPSPVGGLPAGMSMDSGTQTFTWDLSGAGSYMDPGSYAVRVVVEDGSSSDFEDVTIRVIE